MVRKIVDQLASIVWGGLQPGAALAPGWRVAQVRIE
jgi:hypothetical protein